MAELKVTSKKYNDKDELLVDNFNEAVNEGIESGEILVNPTLTLRFGEATGDDKIELVFPLGYIPLKVFWEGEDSGEPTNYGVYNNIQEGRTQYMLAQETNIGEFGGMQIESVSINTQSSKSLGYNSILFNTQKDDWNVNRMSLKFAFLTPFVGEISF